MPSPVIPKPVLIVTVHCSTAAGRFVNISYWEPITPYADLPAVVSAAVAADALVATLYTSAMSNTARYDGVQLEYLDGTHSWVGTASTNANPGTIASDGISDQNACVIRKETGLVGRSNLGRFFLGGMPQNAFDPTDPDEVDAAYLALVQPLAAFYGADQVFGTNCHARHWNRKTNALVPLLLCQVSSRLATRRDRRRHAYDLGL